MCRRKEKGAFMSRKHIVALTGAGISAESGLSTFRDENGLWHKFRVEDVATPQAFARNPALVLDFYNQRRAQLRDVRPNQAHTALARLEQGYRVSVVTQNVDDLHERGGSTNVLHLHGELRLACSSLNQDYVVDIGYEPIILGDVCPDGGQMRPAIVWFGEPVPMMDRAREVVASADLLMVIGTSLAVYPAAFLAQEAPPGAPVLVIDPKAEPGRIPGAVIHLDTAARRVLLVVEELLREG